MDFSIGTLTAFALTSLVIELTPGPNLVYLAILTLSEGRPAGYAAVAGVAFGLLLLGLMAAFGFGVLARNSPSVYEFMRWVGVAYLLWLAWDGWSSAGSATIGATGKTSHRRHFARGFITNMLNPKAGIFYVALLPNFIDIARPMVGQAIVLTIIYVTIATVIHTSIVTAAGAALPLLEDRRQKQIIRRILSVGLVAVAFWLAWSTKDW